MGEPSLEDMLAEMGPELVRQGADVWRASQQGRACAGEGRHNVTIKKPGKRYHIDEGMKEVNNTLAYDVFEMDGLWLLTCLRIS